MFSKFSSAFSDHYHFRISRELIRAEEVNSEQTFQDDPCLAIEHTEGKRTIIAIGRDARALQGAPKTEIFHPLDWEDDAAHKLELVTVLINHSVYEISSRLKKKVLAPSMTLTSEEEFFFEPNIKKEIIQRCGFRKLTLAREL